MRSTKTDKILNLVGGENKGEPVKNANPLVRIPEPDEKPVVFTKDTAGFQLINVTFLLMNEQLGPAMERFNCCTCYKCAAAVTAETLRHFPQIIVPVKRKSDAEKVNKLAAEHRAELTPILTKAIITVKSNPPNHNK